MTIEEFRALPQPPAGVSDAVTALWQDAHLGWAASHDTIQEDTTLDGAWVHAYLHRKEGDLRNSGYWYRRAGKPIASGSFEVEWAEISAALLSGR